MKALVVTGVGAEPRVEEIDLPEPGPGEVRVRVRAAGICHSDLSMVNGTLAPSFPLVLGHEAAGTVVGTGQHVVLNWAPACRECWFCLEGEPYLCVHAEERAAQPYAELDDGTPVYPGLGTGAFAEETVVTQQGVVPIPGDIPLEAAALLGCAVLTGNGAVHNTAQVRPGQSVVVMGLGGVGLSVLQAARAAGAGPIIGVDVTESKAALAILHGATEFVRADEATSKSIRRLTSGRGADHAFDCVGAPATIRASWSASRRGGTVTIIGVGSRKSPVEFNALELYWFGRTLHGCVYGSSDPDVDVPRLLDELAAGRIDIAALATDSTDLTGVNAAFDHFGQGGRTIVRF